MSAERKYADACSSRGEPAGRFVIRYGRLDSLDGILALERSDTDCS
jgi:hypothetical protein